MAAGDVPNGRDHQADGEAMREGDAEQAEAALPGAVQKLVGADGASAKEDQRECPDELRDELLGFGVHRAPPECSGPEPDCLFSGDGRDSTEMRYASQK